MSVISHDKREIFDAPTLNLLKEVNSPIPIVQVNQFSDYQFNPELYDLDKYILADFCEYGANSFDFTTTHLWGKNSEKFKLADGEEWKKFDQFVKDKEPTVYFKRELLSKDMGGNVYPISFPCFWDIPPIQTKEEFNSRVLSVFNSWGYSHELRRMSQGEIYINAVRRNRAVIDNFSHLEQELKDGRQKWLSVFTPWHSRLPMDYVLSVQGMAKLSLSLPGAGAVCFRHSEACINSVMVMRNDPIAWSFPWVDNVNCIKFPFGYDMDNIRGLTGAKDIIERIESALIDPNLYDIYVACVNNCMRYRIDKYVSEYLEPIINKYV